MTDFVEQLTPSNDKESVVFFGTAWGLFMAFYGLLGSLQGGFSFSADSVLFEYIGLSSYKYGTIPYLEVWDIKPPLTHEIMYLVSFISQGDPIVVHIISLCLSLFAITMTIVMAGNLVFSYTENKYNAYIAVLLVSANTYLYSFAFNGFRPKFIVMMLAVTSLYLIINERYISGNFVAILCPALWQLGIIFPIVTLILTYRKTTQELVYKSLGVIALTTLVIISPFIYFGAVTEMIQQVVITPFIASENMTVFDRYVKLPDYLGAQLLFYIGLGVVGTVRGYITRDLIKQHWWVYAIVGFYVFQVLFLDLDYFPDLFLLTTVLGVFYGIIFDFEENDFYIFTFATIALYILFIGDTTVFEIAQSIPFDANAFQITGASNTEQAFLRGEEITECHLRMSRPEQQWMTHYGHTENATVCTTNKFL